MFLLTLFLAFIKPTFLLVYFPFVSLLSFPLCWRWKLKGFVPSCLFIGLFCFFLLFSSPIHEHYWVFGITLSLVLSSLITALSMEEISEIVQGQSNESENRCNQIRRMSQKISEHEKEKNQLIKGSNLLSLELKTYREALLHAQKMKEGCDECKHQKKFEAMCRQLQLQFIEKSKVLDQTRRDLFFEKEKVNALLRENRERRVVLDPQIEKMEKYIVQLDREIKRQREVYLSEVKQLEELISTLLFPRSQHFMSLPCD